ncbi:MAG: hypothetical protein WCD15_00235 [Terriglobales bacterium]
MAASAVAALVVQVAVRVGATQLKVAPALEALRLLEVLVVVVLVPQEMDRLVREVLMQVLAAAAVISAAAPAVVPVEMPAAAAGRDTLVIC